MSDRLIVWLSTNRVMTWLIKHVASPLDPYIFKATNGRLTSMGPPAMPMLTLTTTGRRSGKPRSVHLACVEQQGDYLVVASAMGQQRHPAWHYNIEANPEVEVQISGERFAARPIVLPDDVSDEHAVFLSGNGPLVDVLREALARDQVARDGIKKGAADRAVRRFIQNIHHFRDHYVGSDEVPFEKVVVFDEAQRAWTSDQASKFMQARRGLEDFDMSEPEFLISVMDRHPDWCTVICLIGGGQEINTGEAGLESLICPR